MRVYFLRNKNSIDAKKNFFLITLMTLISLNECRSRVLLNGFKWIRALFVKKVWGKIQRVIPLGHCLNHALTRFINLFEIPYHLKNHVCNSLVNSLKSPNNIPVIESSLLLTWKNIYFCRKSLVYLSRRAKPKWFHKIFVFPIVVGTLKTF